MNQTSKHIKTSCVDRWWYGLVLVVSFNLGLTHSITPGGLWGGGLWLLEGKRVDILCFVHQSFVQFLNRSVGFVVEVLANKNPKKIWL